MSNKKKDARGGLHERNTLDNCTKTICKEGYKCREFYCINQALIMPFDLNNMTVNTSDCKVVYQYNRNEVQNIVNRGARD